MKYKFLNKEGLYFVSFATVRRSRTPVACA